MGTVNHLSNFIAAVNNSLDRKHPFVIARSNSVVSRVAGILLAKGFILGFEDLPEFNGKKTAHIKIDLKYKNSVSTIIKFTLISKNSLRVYKKTTDLKASYNNMGYYILSTPLGIMTADEAKKRSVGGEVLCEIF